MGLTRQKPSAANFAPFELLASRRQIGVAYAPIAVTAACRAPLGQYLAGRAENFLSLKVLTKAPKTKTTTAASRGGNTNVLAGCAEPLTVAPQM
jgi:hypothetical protein